MLQLRVFGAAPLMSEVTHSLSALPGAGHITWTGAADQSDRALVTADLYSDAADPALEALRRLRVAADDISLLRLDAIQPGGRRREPANLVWADLVGQAGQYARPVARYLVFMGVAGMIAGYGVIYSNGILIVGAMSVSPDLLPITAICVALVSRRPRLARRAFVTLVAGLGFAGLVAGVLSAVLNLVGLLRNGFAVGAGVLQGLTTVNSSTFVVALVAGIAGMLAVETRASAAVGVAISVTTIPASAYLGVAAGVGEVGKAAGALAVLAINVTMLVAGGSATLVVQRALARRATTGDAPHAVH
jgi:uncharacterized hydrophobic protein (TIGR00271 family)